LTEDAFDLVDLDLALATFSALASTVDLATLAIGSFGVFDLALLVDVLDAFPNSDTGVDMAGMDMDMDMSMDMDPAEDSSVVAASVAETDVMSQ
jgi:hypothetical protein